MRQLKRHEQGQCAKKLLRKISTAAFLAELLSMHCCVAADRGLCDEDFISFKVGKWLKSASELMQELGLEPHVALVAQRSRPAAS